MARLYQSIAKPAGKARRQLPPEPRRAQLLAMAIGVFAEMRIERAGHGAAFQRMVERHPSEAKTLLTSKTLLKWGVFFDSDIRPAYPAFQDRALNRLIETLPANPEYPAQARAEARIFLDASSLLAAMAFDDFQPNAIKREEMPELYRTIGLVGRIADVLS